jgi:Tol biopolymer transport system component
MTRLTWIACRLAAIVLLCPCAADAQRAAEPTGPNFHKLVAMDSGEVGGASISPDGRWLVFDRDGRSIWIAPADGHTPPVRLLSDGHADSWPYWFPGSDRIVFTSNRPSRGGPNKRYAMTVDIDRETGKAVGIPRQVTTDEVLMAGTPSPDGKWIAYATAARDAMKIVPATGGAAKTVARQRDMFGPGVWSADGKSIHFKVFEQLSRSYRYYSAPISGGPPRLTETGGVIEAPFVADKSAHLHVTTAEGRHVRRVELVKSGEQLAGALDIPDSMTVRLASAFPNGLLATTTDSRYQTRIVSLDGTYRRTVAGNFFADGWTADGSRLIVDNDDTREPFVAILDTLGNIVKRVQLPHGARAKSWDGIVGDVVTFRVGPVPHTPNTATPIFVADLQSGVIRELVPRAFERPPFRNLTGAGGAAHDGNRFLAYTPNGKTIAISATTVDGRSTLVRTFAPFAPNEDVIAASVAGDRVAWGVRAGDSVRIFTARNAASRPVPVLTVRSIPRAALELAWSTDGSMLAINDGADDPQVAIVHVDANGNPQSDIRHLAVGVGATWGLRWAGDGSAIILLGSAAGGDDQVVRVPVNGKDRPTRLTTATETPAEYAIVSPDGKRLVYPQWVTSGSTIWRVDFLPPSGKPASNRP